MKLVSLINMYWNNTYSEVCVDKKLSEEFPIQKGLVVIAFQPCSRVHL
jgi:hypothetical protein